MVNDQNINYMEAIGAGSSGAGFYIQALRKDIDQIKQAQADIQNTRDLIAQKKYDEAAAQYQVVLAGMAAYRHYRIYQLQHPQNSR